MKKLFSSTGLILFLLALLSVSCEKKDKTRDLLIGRWNMVSQKYTEYADGVKDYEETYTFEPGELVVEIFDDGTGKVWEDGDLNDTFTWELNDEVLIIKNEGEEPVETEFTVNETTLTLKVTFEDTYDGVDYMEVSEMVLSRA